MTLPSWKAIHLHYHFSHLALDVLYIFCLYNYNLDSPHGAFLASLSNVIATLLKKELNFRQIFLDTPRFSLPFSHSPAHHIFYSITLISLHPLVCLLHPSLILHSTLLYIHLVHPTASYMSLPYPLFHYNFLYRTKKLKKALLPESSLWKCWEMATIFSKESNVRRLQPICLKASYSLKHTESSEKCWAFEHGQNSCQKSGHHEKLNDNTWAFLRSLTLAKSLEGIFLIFLIGL